MFVVLIKIIIVMIVMIIELFMKVRFGFFMLCVCWRFGDFSVGFRFVG